MCSKIHLPWSCCVFFCTFDSLRIDDVFFLCRLYSTLNKQPVNQGQSAIPRVRLAIDSGASVDNALWKIRSDIVDKALANRVEMLKTAATAIASLIPGAKSL